MIKYCNNCKHNNNGFCFTPDSCYKYSQFEPTIKNSDAKQSEIKQTFTKSNLVIGMIVELRNGEKCLVKQYCYASIEKSMSYLPKYYCDDLSRIDKREPDKDIVKVYGVKPQHLVETLNGDYDWLYSVWERDTVDWSKVVVDTKILVSNDNTDWAKRYFAKYKNGKVYAFLNGSTSFSADTLSSNWEYAKLYKEEEVSI